MTHHHNPHHARRWLVLAILGIAQLMVVLDATIVNIALPSAQKVLHFSNGDRQWVVTANSLTFGALLLLGGRITDPFGRKRPFIRPDRFRHRLRDRRHRPVLRVLTGRAHPGNVRCPARALVAVALTTTFTDRPSAARRSASSARWP